MGLAPQGANTFTGGQKMTKYKEILRLQSLGINNTRIADACGCARSTVISTLQYAAAKGLTWDSVRDWSEKEVADKLLPSVDTRQTYKMPDYETVHREMQKSGVTLNLLWLEYCEQCRLAGELPYKSTQFNKYYADYVHQTKATMHLDHKPDKKFRGAIADSNPVKIRQIDGIIQKVYRKEISQLTSKHVEMLYTNDTDLIDTVKRILNGKPDTYTIGDYMKEQGLDFFTTDKGKPVYKVSLKEGKEHSNYYKKTIDNENYTMLGMLKYYCVEVYRDKKGKTRTWGVRYVDVIRKNKKLFIKEKSLPPDYASHILYLFKNDYIEVYGKNGKVKFKGFYNAVKNIKQNRFYGKCMNDTKTVDNLSVVSTDIVRKFYIDILGRKGGEIRCSEPLSLIREKN
jgi:hypothetical protein